MWVDLVHSVYPEEADHIIKWSAHRVQRPDDKLNHALVLGGDQGIGKDTILEPIKQAVGPWNFKEVQPHHILERFNPHVKAVILRVSEALDLGAEIDRYALYNRLKNLIVTPPDTIRVHEKHLREYEIVNVIGLIITSNYKDAY